VAKVFLIAQPSVSKDGKFPRLELLAEHGEVHVLVAQGDQPSFKPNRTLNDILRQLAELYKPEEDYLVWAGGDTLAAVLLGVALERHGYRNIRWLRIDRPYDPVQRKRVEEGAKYVAVQFDLYPDDSTQVRTA
jgi:hypothetical protein